MKNKLLIAVLLIMAGAALFFRYSTLRSGRIGPGDRSLPVSTLSGSQISSTPNNVPIRFEAVIVNRMGGRCIELFTPDEFEKYSGDPKWAIASTLRFEPGLLDVLPKTGRGMVIGRYGFVSDVQNGPCGIVTGNLFEIDEIDYF